MTTRNLFDKEDRALRELVAGIAVRATAESELSATFDSTSTAANREFGREKKRIQAHREQELEELQQAHTAKMADFQERLSMRQDELEREKNDRLAKIKAQCDAAEEKGQIEYKEAYWAADSIHEAAETEANAARTEIQRRAAGAKGRYNDAWDKAEPIFQRVKLSHAELMEVERQAEQPPGDPQKSILEAFDRGDTALETIEKSKLLKLSKGAGAAIVFVLVALAGAGAGVGLNDPLTYGIAGGVAAIVLAIVTHILLKAKAKKMVAEQGQLFAKSQGEAKQATELLLVKSEADHTMTMHAAEDVRKASKKKADEKFKPYLAKVAEKRETENDRTIDKHAKESKSVQTTFTQAMEQEEGGYQQSVKKCDASHDKQMNEAESAFKKKIADATKIRDTAWDAMNADWQKLMALFGDTYKTLNELNTERFLPWSDDHWNEPSQYTTVPPGIRIGELKVNLADIPDGVSLDPRLKPPLPVETDWPFYLPFPERGALVLKAREQGKQPAVASLQSLVLRFLMSVPPGKVRLTIVDPVGLGENFAAYMNLADYDENLIGARIWTESQQIERRLNDLTSHMENVIQKYLRNQYRSIEEYNAQAGEVAEPFRVLVVANFPTNFSLDAAKRLVSIASSGASCGVYTLVSVDTKGAMPQGFQLADLENVSMVLDYEGGRFAWKDAQLKRFPLTVEKPPPQEQLTRLVKWVGERSRDANRVEVPFEFVAPKPEEVWKSNSAKSIKVPIGRAGATKRQFMELGLGTAQHALVAGKTGSGKSTMLHALITNLALCYDPSQVDLYLIDFKKGVEFKVYAAEGLPHARVIAVESEREFGLSVLQKLDSILKERGELYREAGCNDLAGFREARPDIPSPRIMLIVDEFQEFFVEDDKIAQEVSLLLDRLVRQGRAFGLHVLMGSQTLGGAFSLARSTIDQMAVRIALQCSEADAQLILSKDNVAARLLNRPGEAIYNDQNGLVEGNDPFQVVWLPEEKRENYLKEMRQRAGTLHVREPLVFEGSASAEIRKNEKFDALIAAANYPEKVRATQAWLGEAIAIKDPTAAVFRNQSGANLLILGQSEDNALSVVYSVYLSLALQHSPEKLKISIIDSTPEDDPRFGLIEKLTAKLPHPVKYIDMNVIAPVFQEYAAEVVKRQKGEGDKSPMFLVIHGLQRFRDLRKSDDDFGYGRRGGDKVVSAAENFATILREGPPMGVHVIFWCDSLTNLSRSVDRPGMRELGMRVLFQMSQNDSSALMDSPAASRLGRYRGLFVTEELPFPEKFRPYTLPGDEWIQNVGTNLAKRTVAGSVVETSGI